MYGMSVSTVYHGNVKQRYTVYYRIGKYRGTPKSRMEVSGDVRNV